MADSKGNPSEQPSQAKDKVSDRGKAAGVDPFIREKQFPDAAAVFAHKPSKLSNILASAVFAFDTNALLLPYKTDRLAFEEVKRILTTLAKEKRLILPERVAREFAVHRLGKIAELYAAANDWKKPLKHIEARFSPALELLEEHEEYQKARAAADQKIQECRATLDKILDRLTEWYESDPVLDFYRSVFDGGSIVGCSMSEQSLLEDNDRRNANFVPPGCAADDVKKLDRGIGDKVIWHSLLELAKARTCDLVFVTQDVTKKDWVYFHKESDRVLFPRYELAEEFRRASNGKTFQIIEVSKLLELFAASANVVQAVQIVEQKERTPDEDPDLEWVRRILPLIRKSAHSFKHLRDSGIPLLDQDFMRLGEKFRTILRVCKVGQPNGKWLFGYHSVPSPPVLKFTQNAR